MSVLSLQTHHTLANGIGQALTLSVTCACYGGNALQWATTARLLPAPRSDGSHWQLAVSRGGSVRDAEPGMLQAQACPAEPAVRHAPEHRSPGKDAPGDWCLGGGLDASRVVGWAVSSGCRGLPGRPLWAPLRGSPTATLLLPRAQPGQHGRGALRLELHPGLLQRACQLPGGLPEALRREEAARSWLPTRTAW